MCSFGCEVCDEESSDVGDVGDGEEEKEGRKLAGDLYPRVTCEQRLASRFSHFTSSCVTCNSKFYQPRSAISHSCFTSSSSGRYIAAALSSILTPPILLSFLDDMAVWV